MRFFGNAFDFNNDGKLDAMEQGAELGFLMEMIDSDKNDMFAGQSHNSMNFDLYEKNWF